jgi:hypothetical protein
LYGCTSSKVPRCIYGFVRHYLWNEDKAENKS